MIKKNPMVKFLTTFALVTIIFIMPSCAQEKKRTEQTTPKEQAKTVTMQKVKMPVDGMVCNACQSNVKKTIKSVDGVADVEVNLEKKFAYFTYDPSKVKLEQVQEAVNDKGFTAGKPQEVKQ